MLWGHLIIHVAVLGVLNLGALSTAAVGVAVVNCGQGGSAEVV